MESERIDHAYRCLKSLDLDGFLFTNMKNIRYLTGFTGSDGVFLLTSSEAILMTDSRYTIQAQEQYDSFKVVEYRKKVEGIGNELKRLKVKKIGFESLNMTYSLWAEICKVNAEVDFIPCPEEMEGIRVIKDDVEVDLMRQAAAIAEKGFHSALAKAKVNEKFTEKELAWELEKTMREEGADDRAFDIIVASGKRGALPHGLPTNKIIEKGDLVVIDFGACYQGYNSDQTITVCKGRPNEEQKRIFNTVKEAKEKSLKAIKPGVTYKAIDAAARKHLDACGLGDFFGHGLGHGIGLEVHEDPRVSPFGKGEAEVGVIFTVEPGVYVPEWGGIRLEDMVQVTDFGVEFITSPQLVLIEI